MDAEDATDNMEMEERREQESAEREAEEEEETSFTDDRQRDGDVLDMDDSDPIFTRPDGKEVEDLDIEARLKKMGKSDGKVKRTIIHNKKQFLKDGIGITVNVTDGKSSRDLFKELKISRGKSGKINGAEYKGKKILFLRKGRMRYSEADAFKPYVDEFKELLKRANAEHQGTPAALAEKEAGVDLTQETMDSITKNVRDKIGKKIDSEMDTITSSKEITENELREFRGLLNVKGKTLGDKIKAIEIERDNWKKKAKKEGDTAKDKLYKSISRVADFKADEMRLRLNIKPKTEEVKNMIREETGINDMTKFEKFKKWSRKNLLGLSSLAITTAGLITTIVMATKNLIKKGGEGLKV